jgi:hypothetical protein
VFRSCGVTAKLSYQPSQRTCASISEVDLVPAAYALKMHRHPAFLHQGSNQTGQRVASECHFVELMLQNSKEKLDVML